MCQIISQQTHLFKLEDMLVEVKLQFFICKVDTKLFKTVVLVILKSKNVQNSYRASLELRKRGHYYSIYPKMSICYCALQLTQCWWFSGVTISKLEMDCPSSKSSFLLDNACQKDYRGFSPWTNKPSDFICLFIPLFYKRITRLRWQFISSEYFNKVSHAGSEITTKVGSQLTASSLEWLHDQMAMVYLTDRQFILSLLFYHS